MVTKLQQSLARLLFHEIASNPTRCTCKPAAIPFFRRSSDQPVQKSYLKMEKDGTIISSIPDVQIPAQTVTQFCTQHMATRKKKFPCCTCAWTGRSYNFYMVPLLINSFAKSLISVCHMKPRDTLAVVLPNMPEFVVATHGALTAGLMVILVNPLYSPEDVLKQFTDAQVKMIVTISSLLNDALAISAQLNGYKGTVTVGGRSKRTKNVFSFQNLLMKGFFRKNREQGKVDLERDTVVMSFSSGTTGPPKGVCLTHRNLVSNLSQINVDAFNRSFVPPQSKEYEAALTVLPLFHIYGFNAFMNACLYLCIHMVVLPKFSAEKYAKALLQHEPAYLFVVPSLLHFLATSPSITAKHLKSVRTILCGSGQMSQESCELLLKKANNRNLIIRQGYGMTEASPIMLLQPTAMDSKKTTSAGVLIPNGRIRIVDGETKQVRPAGMHGQLVFKGPNVMKGYYAKAETNSAQDVALDKDGWLHTGDVAYYDEDGFFYIVNRSDEVINEKHEHLAPAALEEILMQYPGKVINDIDRRAAQSIRDDAGWNMEPNSP